MTQAILNSVSSEWKTQTKHIRFINGTDDPSFSDKLDIYSSKLEGELSLSQFPNLRSIAFQSNNIHADSLESIDISENAKLNKIVLSEDNPIDICDYFSCNLLIKERQLSQIVISYYKLKIVDNGYEYMKRKLKLLKQQTIMPYILVENKKIEQLEAEARRSNQIILEKDQQIEILKKEIENLKKKDEQTPTFSQFEELIWIVFLTNTDFDFNNLKHEIKRLKLKEMIPYSQKEKYNFTQLVTNAKNKAGTNLENILDILLQAQKQMIERGQENDPFTQGQLSAYQNLLQNKLNSEELQILLDKQKKLLELEKDLLFLQTQEEVL